MAVKASNSITVYDQTDVLRVTTFYQRLSSTANPPSAPTTTTTAATVSGWSTTMPAYGSSYRCYKVERSERGDGSCVWGTVTEDQSWAGANSANSTATSASQTATAVQTSLDNLEIGGRNRLINTGSPTTQNPVKAAVYTGNPHISNCTVTYSGEVASVVLAALQRENYIRFIPPNSASCLEQMGLPLYGDYVFSGYVKTNLLNGDELKVRLGLGPSAYGNGFRLTNLITGDSLYGIGAIKIASDTTNEWTRFAVHINVSESYKAVYFFLSFQVYTSAGSTHASANGTYQFKKLKFEAGTKATDWTPAPEDVDASISTVSTAANGAAYWEQTIYRAWNSTSSTPSVEETWCTNNTADYYTAWTTVRPTYSQSYPLLYTAVQRQTVAQKAAGTTCSCTTPVLDKTTTVIDGGSIITNSIHADSILTDEIQQIGPTSGKHMVMTANGVDIMDDDAILAGFGENVKFCNELIEISGTASNTENTITLLSEKFKRNSSGTEIVDSVYDHPTGTFYMSTYTINGGGSMVTSRMRSRADANSPNASFEAMSSNSAMGNLSRTSMEIVDGSSSVLGRMMVEYNATTGKSTATINADNYIVANGDDFVDAIGALPTTGGTITGDTDIKSTNITDGTPPGSDTRGKLLYWTDSASNVIGYIQPYYRTTEVQGMHFYARRSVGGSNVNHGIQLEIDSSGNRSVTVTDQAAWRTGIGAAKAGVVKSNATSQISMASGYTLSSIYTSIANETVLTVSITFKNTSALTSGTEYTIGTLATGLAPYGTTFRARSGYDRDEACILTSRAVTYRPRRSVSANSTLYISATYVLDV